MILYYAMGGGLGHLTRARAVLHTLGIKEPVTLLTSSVFGDDKRVVGDVQVVRVPQGLAADPPGYRRWLLAAFLRVCPTAIYLDAFPAGLLGELGDFPFPEGVPVFHVARILKVDVYRERIKDRMPRIRRSYAVEPLGAEHEEWLRQFSEEVVPLFLSDPPDPPLSQEHLDLMQAGQPVWLLVHSGPDREIAELLGYAADLSRTEGTTPRVVVVSPLPPWETSVPDVVDLYPATPLFPHADRIITACGFNAMRQAAPFAERHRFLPFPRRFDDQFLRAARASTPSLSCTIFPR